MTERVDLFKLGMRRLAAGVSLITTLDADGSRHGMVATSVTSVCLTPPSLLTCVNQSASSHDTLAKTGFFCVNLLAESDDQFALRYSSSAMRHLRFTEDCWGALETGAPVLDGAIASFDCRVTSTIAAASHTIFIGEVVAVKLPEGKSSPLLYLDGAFARCARPA